MAAPAALERAVERELLTQLKAATAVTDLVPVASIAPQGEPTWPFILLEGSRTNRLRMACVRGAIVNLDIHAFAGPRFDAGAMVETGRDHIARIAAAIQTTLADNRVALPDGPVCRIELNDTQLLKDGEPSSYHWFSGIRCRVLAE